MNTVRNMLMSIIQNELTGQPVDLEAFHALSDHEREHLAILAQEHSVANLLGDALGKEPATKDLELTRALVYQTMMAVAQTAKMEMELESICRELDNAKIAYIKLKGARVRQYYPEPWMRTSCDIDILVHEEDVESAVSALCEHQRYRLEGRNYHDVSLFSPSGVHLELHFNICENQYEMDQVLNRVWHFSKPQESGVTWAYEQSNEYFLFHILAHMAHHFVAGGCGIRSLVDLWLLRDKMPYEESEVAALCEQAGIGKFYKNILRMIDVWFNHGVHTELTETMEKYILSGGTYGTQINQIASAQNRTGGKMGYMLHRIFMPTQDLCIKYPSLIQHTWLMPAYQVRRWSDALFGGKMESYRAEFKTSQTMDSSFSDEIQFMLEENGFLS